MINMSGAQRVLRRELPTKKQAKKPRKNRRKFVVSGNYIQWFGGNYIQCFCFYLVLLDFNTYKKLSIQWVVVVSTYVNGSTL